MTSFEVPTTGLADFVKNLAQSHGVRYVRSEIDDMADVITRLSDDEVVTDETEDLIVELKRSKVIDSSTMVSLLGNYLDERNYVRPIQRL